MRGARDTLFAEAVEATLRTSLRYVLGLIGAGVVLAALALALTPIRADGFDCRASAVHVSSVSIMNAPEAPAQAGVVIAACLSARQTRQHLVWELSAAGAVLILGAAFARPRTKASQAEPSLVDHERA